MDPSGLQGRQACHLVMSGSSSRQSGGPGRSGGPRASNDPRVPQLRRQLYGSSRPNVDTVTTRLSSMRTASGSNAASTANRPISTSRTKLSMADLAGRRYRLTPLQSPLQQPMINPATVRATSSTLVFGEPNWLGNPATPTIRTFQSLRTTTDPFRPRNAPSLCGRP